MKKLLKIIIILKIMKNEGERIKITFIGDEKVGKSSILGRFIKERFEEDYQATIGLDFFSNNSSISDKILSSLLLTSFLITVKIL